MESLFSVKHNETILKYITMFTQKKCLFVSIFPLDMGSHYVITKKSKPLTEKTMDNIKTLQDRPMIGKKVRRQNKLKPIAS